MTAREHDRVKVSVFVAVPPDDAFARPWTADARPTERRLAPAG